MKFAVRELRWTKRRGTDKQRIVDWFEVLNFKKEDNSYCDVNVIFDDGCSYDLKGRVSVNVFYKSVNDKLEETEGAWTINAIDAFDGTQVLLELIE